MELLRPQKEIKQVKIGRKKNEIVRNRKTRGITLETPGELDSISPLVGSVESPPKGRGGLQDTSDKTSTSQEEIEWNVQKLLAEITKKDLNDFYSQSLYEYGRPFGLSIYHDPQEQFVAPYGFFLGN